LLCSLSLRERVGVRGQDADFQLQIPSPGMLAHSALSPEERAKRHIEPEAALIREPMIFEQRN
jgi:hypothetical protein